jgi:4-aminobutyrate aminotransferase
MAALEFRDPKSRITGVDEEGKKMEGLPNGLHVLVQNECIQRHLLILTTSIFPVLRLIPALIVDEAEVARALDILAKSIAAVAQSLSNL